ncbi:uncharacterized protein [Gossypium hirsutum]|uniref:MULE transposase domain-containing protein n=1 Tax=Gossypium hirsutum TaxID=3635 RepID=A0ABM3A5H7_GOSHI|nr:uncharacterized protein LOC121217813 [Gossypium hirsutum]
MSQDHQKLDAKSICNCIMPLVKENPIIPVSTLIADMQAQFQYRVSYRKAWLVKQMAMQQLYGDWDESYNELQGPNGQLELGRRVFRRLFWTFDPCVKAFSHCKPLVQVDGTWLYGKYTQILLIAVAQDSNGNVLPIAFAIMESENSKSSKGLVAAIRQSEVPWRSIYCIRHIAANFHNQYKNKDWRKRIVNMGYKLEAHRFRHKLARLETDMAGSNPPLRQWLGSMEPWQWAQCFDEGYRYGQMTTNLVEAINSILRHTRHLPISVVFSAIFSRLTTLMPKMGLKQVKQLEAGHVYVEKIRDAMK